MARVKAKTRSKRTVKGKKDKRRKKTVSVPTGRTNLTRQAFASELILRGLGISASKAENIAYNGERHAYETSNKALVVIPSVRALFDKAFAKAKDMYE